MVKSDNKEDGTASMRNKYRHRIKTDEKEQSTPEKQTQQEIKEFKPMEDKEETKTKEKSKTYPYSKYNGKNVLKDKEI